MCRFAFYTGPEIGIDALVTRPKNSIIHQSYENAERAEPLNGDGFGIAWYAPRITPEPALFRSVSPAWSNGNLLSLARVTQSPCILAHVRAATAGLSVVETNCHPFTVGDLAFMHNGDCGGFRTVKRALAASLSDDAYQAIAGTTDSEHLFALFRDRWAACHQRTAHAMLDALKAAFEAFFELGDAAGVTDDSWLNVVVTDGTLAVATRYTTADPSTAESLHVHVGRRYVCDGDVCRMIDPDVPGQAVLIASEQLSDDAGWDVVPVNHAVVVHADRNVDVVPLGLSR
jgi:glutamine amidotransferase